MSPFYAPRFVAKIEIAVRAEKAPNLVFNAAAQQERTGETMRFNAEPRLG
jgi:hypothetical protein